MSAPVRPSGYPRWADTGATAITEPPSGKKDVGWAVAEKPPAQFMNFLMNNYYQWILYLDQLPSSAWQEPGAPYLERGGAPSLIMEYKGVNDGGAAAFGPAIRVLAKDPGFGLALFGLPLRTRYGQQVNKVDVRGANGTTGLPLTLSLMQFRGYTGVATHPQATTLASGNSPSGVNKEWIVTLSTPTQIAIDSNITLVVDVQSNQINDLIYGTRIY